MVGEVRIYVEGGGDCRATKSRVREGFAGFLRELVEIARAGHVRWSVIVCGGRQTAFEAYETAKRQHPEAANVLLVDSERPVTGSACEHLRQPPDGWAVTPAEQEHLQLMVQTVEHWLIADLDAVESYYGQGFRRNPIPANVSIEAIGRSDLERGLRAATQDTKKGPYHKTRHCPDLLRTVESSKVREACPHCMRVFRTLAEQMGSTAFS